MKGIKLWGETSTSETHEKSIGKHGLIENSISISRARFPRLQFRVAGGKSLLAATEAEALSVLQRIHGVPPSCLSHQNILIDPLEYLHAELISMDKRSDLAVQTIK